VENGATVDVIAVSAQSDSLVPVAANGEVIRPCLLWMDSRGVGQAARLAADLGEEAIHEHTGLRSDRSFTAPKVAWLRDEEPASFRRLRWMAQPKDFLVQRLTGRMATDPSTASRSLVFDRASGDWWPAMVKRLGMHQSQLPEIVGSAEIVGGLAQRAAGHLGLQGGIPVVCGGADRACEALAVALRGPRVMVASGTATGVTTTIPSSASALPSLMTPAHVIPGRSLAHLSLPTSGSVLDWFSTIAVGTASHLTVAGLVARALSAPPGSNGVVVRPSFMGMRSVHWDPTARGAILGVTLATNTGDIARAILEGIAFEVGSCIGELQAAGVPVDEVALLGSTHRSDWICQMMADVLSRNCFRPVDQNPALTGAMLLGGAAVGLWPDPEAEADRRLARDRDFEPDPVGSRTYSDLALAYVKLAYGNPTM
jgi:xylulokinase